MGNLKIVSNVPGLKTGGGLPGNVEFWPNNYGPANAGNVPGADGGKFDFGDEIGEPADGYGCLQVHHTAAKQAVLAVNNWRAGVQADIGIGNSGGESRDWTFTGEAGKYETARLRVLVRRK